MNIKEKNTFEKNIDQFASKNFVDIMMNRWKHKQTFDDTADPKPIFIKNKTNYRSNLANQSYGKGKDLPSLDHEYAKQKINSLINKMNEIDENQKIVKESPQGK